MEAEKTLISWWSWPAKQKPARALFAWLVIACALFLCAQWGIALAIGIGVALLSTLSEVLLPTFYKLQTTALYVHALHTYRRIPWTNIQAIKIKECGFLLDIYSSSSSRKNLFLYCNSNKEKIGLVLEQKIAENQP